MSNNIRLIQALSRMASNRQSDGRSSLVSAEDREAIINGCHDLLIASKQGIPPVDSLVGITINAEEVKALLYGVPKFEFSTALSRLASWLAEHDDETPTPTPPVNHVEGVDIPRLPIGTPVTKVLGYSFPGTVVAAFHTLSGQERFVVEATGEQYAGMLHIFNGDQLRAAAPGAGKPCTMLESAEIIRQINEDEPVSEWMERCARAASEGSKP